MNTDENKTTIRIPISVLISAIALIISVYNMISIHNLFVDNKSEVSLDNVSENRAIPYPYYNQTQTVAGITATVNPDKTVTVSGTATEDSVVFRFIANDKTVKIPLDNKVFALSCGVDSAKFDAKCRMDVGLLKTDGSTEILNGYAGEFVIDNTSDKYSGIYGLSIYCVKGFTAPDGYTFNVSLKEK